MNKLNKVLGIVNGNMLMELVQEVNSWDSSLDYLQYIEMDLLDDYLIGVSPTDLANMIHYGDFNPNDTYFIFNGYGNLESYKGYEVLEELEYYKEDIVERFIELYEDSHIETTYQEILDILDNEEEEDQEEE